MPSHYDKPLPKRKPAVPSRAIRGDAPTRGMNPAEIEAALEAGEITEKEAMNMMKNLQRMQKANKMAKGGFPDHNKDNEITQADVLMARGAIPKPTKAAYGGMMKPKKPEMMGGGMKKKRNANIDYRKGGMVYSTKVKKG